MLNQKFMEKILEDFPCWKAKFTVLKYLPQLSLIPKLNDLIIISRLVYVLQ